MQALQHRFRYLPQEGLDRLCEITEMTAADAAGVSSFYTQFRRTPAGKHTIAVCHGTACHVKGAPAVTEALLRILNIPEDSDTTADRMFTVEKVACLGCCTLAPAVKIDEITYGHQTPDTVKDMVADFINKLSDKKDSIELSDDDRPKGDILLGLGSCCISRGSGDVHYAVQTALAETGAAAKIKRVGCVGMCHRTPLLDIITPDGKKHRYSEVNPDDARRIVLEHFSPQGFHKKVKSYTSNIIEKFLTDESWRPVRSYLLPPGEKQVEQFLGPQKHIATEHFGFIDPAAIEEYKGLGGFTALDRCINELTPNKIIETITSSGLRGRGGAGFPTGRKWKAAFEAAGDQKYVICNGDEGDPGAFMDRMLLESFPFRIIEGMAIAAHTIGAGKGIFYIRAEYPLALERVRDAISKCREANILNENFDLEICEGAGAFICGEETALLESIEGRRGTPRLRPPFPAVQGLYGKPTLINNVETYANIPWIINNDPKQFSDIGIGESKGTKVFALAGKINRGGLVEVPMGMPLRQIIDDIGGGVQYGKSLKAVQIGGPSGGCVPEALIDTRVDYEALLEAGSMMGSGGMVVLDQDDCMVEIARYFLEFTQDQSCGKCTFCRIGTRRMLDILEDLCSGKAKEGQITELESLAKHISQASLCQLGRTAPNPVLSTLEHFRQEYHEHIAGKCPAGKCRDLITLEITEDCIGCTKCAQNCPVGAIEFLPLQQHIIDTDKCIRCGGCKALCPVDAIETK